MNGNFSVCQSCSNLGGHRIGCASNYSFFSPQQKLVISNHFTHSTGGIYSGSTQNFSLFSPGLLPSCSWMCSPSSEGPKVSVEKRELNWGQHPHNVQLGSIHCVLSPSTLVVFISFWAHPRLCLLPSTSEDAPGLSSHVLPARSLPTCRHVAR